MPLVRDSRHAVRSLVRSPGFTLVAVLTLALGIGANTAIFSIMNSVLIAPLRYREPDRIVTLATRFNNGRLIRSLTGGDLDEIRKSGQLFEALSFYFGGELGVQVAGRAEFTGAFFVNRDFFGVFGVQPVFGRAFDGEGQAAVSLAFAQRNFGEGANAIGRTLSIENKTYTISGVFPAGLDYPAKANVWVSVPDKPESLDRQYRVVARLRRSVPVENAQAALDTIGTRLAAASPATNRDKTFAATPLREQLVGPVRTMLYFLMGAVALVLLIACMNVADLMLARATTRSRETAVRTSLGAGRWQIVRPLLVESIILALAGGSLGLLLAIFGTGALSRLSAAAVPLPRLAEIHLDSLVLGFVTAVSLGCSILFGLAPAFQASRVDIHEALKQGSRSMTGVRSPHLRHALVIVQIALSLVLAVGAGLLLRSFSALNNVALGYRTDGILVMYAHAPARTLAQNQEVGRNFDELFARIGGLPGVTAVAGVMGLPSGQYGMNGSYALEGKSNLRVGQHLSHADFTVASPGYFAVMGIPLTRGRDFTPRDDFSAPWTVIISEALARDSFPNEDPIGRRIMIDRETPTWMTVVGVVGDVRQNSPASPLAAGLYMPLKQHPFLANELQVVVRTSGDAASLAPAVREQTRALNPEIATKFITMKNNVGDSIAQPRFRTLLLSAFAGLALVLAMVGVYGVMNYVVTQRTSEFGLRAALGARPGDVIRLVLGRTVRLAAIGLAIGLELSIALSRVLTAMLFELKPTDPATYVLVLFAVTPMILAASVIPARRAARIDPLSALRNE